MKIFLTILSVVFINNTFAAPEIKACTAKQLTYLNKSVSDQRKDGFVNVKFFKNAADQVVGFYSWDKAEEQIVVEVCEALENDAMTVASTWYYWDTDNESTNPSKFKKGATYFITQDEGMAKLQVLEKSKQGLKLKLSVIGWDGDGEEVLVRESVLSL